MFQPYTRQQLEIIARTRLDGLNVFESRAIEYAARKVRQPSTCLSVHVFEINETQFCYMKIGDLCR